MNISKKALMSVLMALTSLAAMAQPYYHVMKQDGSKLTEKATYDGQTYKVKIDMVEPEVKTEARPECAIGNKITVTSGKYPYKTRSFYFTNKGNVYYRDSKFHFEKSQLDYPSGTLSTDRRGYFGWGRTLSECSSADIKDYSGGRSALFYFANPDNLGRLQEDLGNEKWTVLTAEEWDYVCKNLGESGWTVDGKRCFLIDTTPGKSLLRTIETKNGGKTMSKEDFFDYETQGLVCLPPSGWLRYQRSEIKIGKKTYVGYSPFYELQDVCGFYWSCTSLPHEDFTTTHKQAFYVISYLGHFTMTLCPYNTFFAVRLVVLAD